MSISTSVLSIGSPASEVHAPSVHEQRITVRNLQPASNQSGASLSVSKVHTLQPSTSYVMKFSDIGGNGTEVHFQLGWSEQYNGGHDVWVNYGTASVDNGFILKPQESLTFDVSPLDNLVAFSSQPTKLNVMRQVVE